MTTPHSTSRSVTTPCKLLNAQTQQTLLPRLEVARTLWTRNKGLLGRQHLSQDEGLWILRCNAIHTFFMKFSIDVIFLNRRMEVIKTLADVKPGRLVLPVWNATSVIELAEGFLKQHPVRIGDKLHVDPALS